MKDVNIIAHVSKMSEALNYIWKLPRKYTRLFMSYYISVSDAY